MTAYASFFADLVRFEIDLWNRLEDLQAESRVVSLAQLQALRAVHAQKGGARVQDVAGELQITVGAASKLVDRLERDGLAERSPHPTDRRSMLIALTAEGESAFAEASDAQARNLEALLGAAMTPERAAELATVLSGLSSSLER